MQVRPARPEEAAAAIRVLRRSITELCKPDHHNEPSALDEWLANKTEANFLGWLRDPETMVLLATSETGEVLGVGAYRTSGEITLNYVSPDARGTGVSTALLQHMEVALRLEGRTTITLTSTATARNFYLGRGYVDEGVRDCAGSDAACKMVKRLE